VTSHTATPQITELLAILITDRLNTLTTGPDSYPIRLVSTLTEVENGWVIATTATRYDLNVMGDQAMAITLLLSPAVPAEIPASAEHPEP
jgi:hypothetical protein